MPISKIILLCVTMFALLLSWNSHSAVDGEFWIRLNSTEKLIFITAFGHGQNYALDQASYVITNRVKENFDLSVIMLEDLNKIQVFPRVEPETFIKAVDQFYSGPLNAKISAYKCFQLIQLGYSGASKDKIESLTAAFRKHASKE